MRLFNDTFSLLPEAQDVNDVLVSEPEFSHLRRARIGCVASERAITDRGTTCRALIVKPAQLSGKQIERTFHEWALAMLLAPLYKGELPDFVIFFDAALWRSATQLEREQLCYHELTHVQQRLTEFGAPKFERDGSPALRLVAHDAEVFYSELRRYGRVVPAFDQTAIAIADGARNATRRRLKVANR